MRDVGRREGGRCPIVVIHKLCVDQPRVYHTTSCIDAVFRMLQSQVLGQDITRRTSRFFVGHRPPSRLPSRLPDVTHVTLSPRPSPPFLYCKRSKLEPGTAWERGYVLGVSICPVSTVSKWLTVSKRWTIPTLNRKELEMQRSELLWSLSGTHTLFFFRLPCHCRVQQSFNLVNVLISKNFTGQIDRLTTD